MRDEYQIFSKPRHGLVEYIKAHQMAGDLKLTEEPKPQKPDEQVNVLARLSRAPAPKKSIRKW